MTELEEYNRRHLPAVHRKELDILCAIHDICSRHGIDYWLDGGTCLGAVRHKGFIPWDDDIDIAMRTEDIARFAEATRKELPEGLFLQTQETDPSCRLPMIKVRDKDSFVVEYGDDFSRPYCKGLFVDIFPMHAYPTVSRGFCKRVCRGYCRANGILRQQHVYSWRAAAELLWFGGKRAYYYIMWKAANMLSSHDAYFGNRICDNGYGIMHRTDSIFPVKPISFEGKEFYGPADPDAYLKDLYRNYMELPPEDKRKGHAVFFIESLSDKRL